MKHANDGRLRVGVEVISAGLSLDPSAGGMAIYYEGLLPALAQSDTIERLITFAPPWHVGYGIPHGAKIQRVNCRGLPRNRIGRVFYEQLVLPVATSLRRPDVLLSTCNVKPLLWRGASVVVLHQVQFLFFPELYTRLRHAYLRVFVKKSLEKADAVIAVSEWERDQVLAMFDVEPDRVFTVYHGLSNLVKKSRVLERGNGRAQDERPYVVFVSTLYRLKNHTRLIEAFGNVVHTHAIPHELLIVGGDADMTIPELESVALRCGVADRLQFLGPVHHEQIPAIIADADVVAYPSLMETFGHPILEALSLGRCVLTSNRGAMAEVAGGAARLVDPTDVEDMAQGLADLILDPSLRERLAKEGPRRAAEFTWERCAEGTMRALRYAVARRSA